MRKLWVGPAKSSGAVGLQIGEHALGGCGPTDHRVHVSGSDVESVSYPLAVSTHRPKCIENDPPGSGSILQGASFK
jgi:hypothetical protein